MKTKTFGEQIADLEAARAAKAARVAEVMQMSIDEGRTTEDDEAEEVDTITEEIKAIDSDLVRLRAAEKLNQDKAKPVDGTHTQQAASDSRAPTIIKTVKNEEPGTGYARLAMAMWASKGELHTAKSFAEAKFPDDIRLNSVMKAAVEAGTTTDPVWAGALVDYRNLSSEFVDFLRPATIIGKFGVDGVPALRRVPFNVRIPGKTTKGRARWVGEGFRKPPTSSGYDSRTLGFSKVAGISVITDEVNRFSDPAVQVLVRDDLRDAIVERIDTDLVDPTKALGTGEEASPASITNGVTAVVASEDHKDDISRLWGASIEANMPLSTAVYITTPSIALTLSHLENAVGGRVYPNMKVQGGTMDGVSVIVSNYVPEGLFILAFAGEIYLADDGVATIDVSHEATIVMDDGPDDQEVTFGMLSNMFQENKIAIRAERYIHWVKRRPAAVAYLSGVAW